MDETRVVKERSQAKHHLSSYEGLKGLEISGLNGFWTHNSDTEADPYHLQYQANWELDIVCEFSYNPCKMH